MKANINVYASLVSGIKSFTHNASVFPTELQMQKYLQELVSEIALNDSLAVSLVNTDQIFQYSVTPYEIDPAHLKGLNVREFRLKSEIDRLDSLMFYGQKITLFVPINLMEGYPAIPFNYPARDVNDSLYGYIAPVLSTRYLLNSILDNGERYSFLHRFTLGDIVFTRYKVYDGTKVYHAEEDLDFLATFDDARFTILEDEIDFCGLPLTIATRYKVLPEEDYLFTYLLALWFVFLVTFVIVAVLQMRKNQLFVSKLKTANIEISKKSEQQERNLIQIQSLLREIHHRVKNNMQIISSLLNLQCYDQSDPNVVEALQMCRSRVQSMALVHQKLYGNEKLYEINLCDYTKNLSENITTSIDVSGKQVTINIEVAEEIHLDIDTIIPLGLILNELITNSHKYAFNEIANPEITIQIQKSDKEKYYDMTYIDNGPGFEMENIRKGAFGIELVQILTEQLFGEMTYEQAPKSTYSISFKSIK